MRGETVIVRTYGNQPSALKVWDADSKHVCVCDEEIYQLLSLGISERNPIGFPREDVFYYDPKLWQEVEREYEANPSVWNKLKPWRGNDEIQTSRETSSSQTGKTPHAPAAYDGRGARRTAKNRAGAKGKAQNQKGAAHKKRAA
jgi:hypothetical protein